MIGCEPNPISHMIGLRHLRARARTPLHQAAAHSVRQRDLRHKPAQVMQDRRPGVGSIASAKQTKEAETAATAGGRSR